MKHHRFTNSTGTISIRGTESGGAFKSKLECHAFIRWVSRLDVAKVELQRPRIIYLDADGNKRRYTGDLLVRFHSRANRLPLVIECKYKAKLLRDPDLIKKLNQVEKALIRLDYKFLIQTEDDVHAEGFNMMKFIFSHRNNDPHPAQQEIMDFMALYKVLTLGQLISALRTNVVEQSEIVPEVWRLVAIQKLAVNYSEILNHAAKISLPSV
jgi:hypothetical protein